MYIGTRIGGSGDIAFPLLWLAHVNLSFLNQAHAGLWPAHDWFLEITFVRDVSMRVCVCVCVCVSAPKAINN